MIGVYKIQSILKPNRIYIGCSINIIKRWKSHISDLKYNTHKSKKLQRHYNKYGINDLQFSILLECDKIELIRNEQYYLDVYNTYFNTCKIAGINLGYKHYEKTKLKMRKPKSQEHKNKLSKSKQGYIPWNKGKKGLYFASEETKLKQSIALKGKPKLKKVAKSK
jgi:group I intron endonuclease